MKIIISLIAGLLFGFGLTFSQMVDPDKVKNFLDIFGQWDPSLAFVMVGAISVFSSGYFIFIKKRSTSKNGEPISHELNQAVDSKLITGASMFGIGWGLTGICPGPALVNLSGGEVKVFVFIIVMIFGMKVASTLKNKGIL